MSVRLKGSVGSDKEKSVYLRDLAVFPSEWEASNRFTKIFSISTHIVVEPVLAWIPRNKIKLDDLAKLNVAAGKPETPGKRYDKWQGVGTYYVTDFDFERYATLAESAQQEIVLALLGEAFKYVADQSHSDASLCFAAIDRVRQTGLPLPRLNSLEFWNSLPLNKQRSKSFREEIEFSARIVDRDQAALQPAAGNRIRKRGASSSVGPEKRSRVEFLKCYVGFLNELERIAVTHHELTDTDVRERLHEVINYYFVWGKKVGRSIPKRYAMFSAGADRLVYHTVQKFIVDAAALAGKNDIAVGASRHALLENRKAITAKRARYDTFLGSADRLLVCKTPSPDKLFKYRNTKKPVTGSSIDPIDVPIGTVFLVRLTKTLFGALVFIGCRELDGVPEPLFSGLAWQGREIPPIGTLEKSARISFESGLGPRKQVGLIKFSGEATPMTALIKTPLKIKPRIRANVYKATFLFVEGVVAQVLKSSRAGRSPSREAQQWKRPSNSLKKSVR